MARAAVIAAPTSGSGKTLVTLGLLRAFRDRGLKVASAKIGPDYIDPKFHEAATGRACFNLDPWAMDGGQLGSLLSDLGHDADLILIEGVMGLFDGPIGARGSTADLAARLNLPVILTIDARRQGQSIGALVHGYTTYRPDVAVEGIILNRVASGRHAEMLRESVAANVIGILRHDDSLELPSRHLGLIQAQEIQQLESFIASAALAVARETILDRILRIARQPIGESVIRDCLPPPGQNTAIADDEAFAFAYPHLLHQWRKAGARMSFFSPLRNEAPDPSADNVYLPGGYPELHAGRLAAAQTFINALRQHKGRIYGECGGYMVLGEALIDKDGTPHAMAGLLPVTTSFAARKLHLGYRQLKPLAGTPWPKPLRGHEFHFSTLVSEGKADRLFEASDAAGQPLPPMGLRRGNVMGSFAHVICEAP